MTFIESYYQQCTKGFSYYKNHYAKVTIISSQNKSFLAHNWILLTSPTARYKIKLLYFTTFSSNKNLFLSALRASRNKFNYDTCKTFILAFDYYHLRIIIILVHIYMEFVYKIIQALKLVIFTRISDIIIYENWISLYFFLVRTGKFPWLVNILSFH